MSGPLAPLVLKGDCLVELARIPDASVDTIVTSPPYYGLRDYGHPDQIGAEATVGEYVERILAVMRELRRVLSPTGVLWLNLGDSYANDAKWGGATGGKAAAGLHGNTGAGRGKRRTGLPAKSLIGAPWRVALAMIDDGWILRSDVVWAKPNPMPESVRDRPTRAHEFVFMFTKNQRYFYDPAAVAEPATGGASGNGFARPEAISRGGRGAPTKNRRDVWTITPRGYKGAHFAVMPLELATLCVRASTPPGGVVLDPFAGSGTTLEAAYLEGFESIGIEMTPDYWPLIAARIERVTR